MAYSDDTDAVDTAITAMEGKTTHPYPDVGDVKAFWAALKAVLDAMEARITSLEEYTGE